MVEQYQCKLVNQKKEGFGRAIYERGHEDEILVTQWYDGKKNGKGFVYNKDTKRIIRRVEFKDDEPIKEEIIQDQNIITGIIDGPDGTRWEGEIINGEACGVGRIYNSKNELIYEGFYIDGAREGYGKSYFEGTGSLAYEGLWCRDMRHGEGTSYDRVGNLAAKGLFLEDNFLEVNIVIRSFSDIDSLSTLTQTIVVSDNSLNELKTLDLSECRKLQTLEIGSNCCKNVCLFRMNRLRELKSVKVGRFSFTSLQAPTIPENLQKIVESEHRSFEISYCPHITSIQIDSFSFFEFEFFSMCCEALNSVSYSAPHARRVPSLSADRRTEWTNRMQFRGQSDVAAGRMHGRYQ